MGRKPKALIVEFFQRGPKLEDASNRYQQICKHCGERFPKGRQDSLVNHITKKCPAIPVADRQRAILGFYNLPDSIASQAEGQANGQKMEMGVDNQHWTPLQTLAEVSRQIDLNEKHDDRATNNESAGAGSNPSEQPQMSSLDIQEQWTPENPPLSYEARVQRDKKVLTQKLASRPVASTFEVPVANMGQPLRSPDRSPGLSMQQASSLAAAASARFAADMVDPQLLSDAAASLIHSHPEQPVASVNEEAQQQISWPMLDGSGGSMYAEPEKSQLSPVLQTSAPPPPTAFARVEMPRLAAKPTTGFSTEYGNGMKATRPKVRGRFDPIRRKEVQAVRKEGACLRCRMLRKPCSPGTPCDTCAHVESARLWKMPCERTRLPVEFEKYAAGIYTVLSFKETQKLKARYQFKSSTSQIDTTHYLDESIYATFNALDGVDDQAGSEQIDPSFGLEEFTIPNLKFKILDDEHDDLPAKVEGYMKRIQYVIIEREPSRFMQVTLATAHNLAIEKSDTLLCRVIEYWCVVHVVVATDIYWQIFERVETGTTSGHGSAIDRANQQDNHRILDMQLRAAAEKKMDQMAKSVVTDFERRLLLRDESTYYETYMVALILFNALERMTWLYKTWEVEVEKNAELWPLERPPAWYSGQGERLVNLMQLLLNIRRVPPKTYRTDDGLVALKDADHPAKPFFERLALNYDEVANKQLTVGFDPADSRSFELRFCSMLLIAPNT